MEESGVSRFLRFAKRIEERHGEMLVRVAQEIGLSKPEADVLLFLTNNPTLNTASDVAKYRGFSRAYVSKAVEGLLEREYIEAQTECTDRRVQRLRLLPASQAARRALHRAQSAFFERLLTGVTHEELLGCVAVLERMMDNAARASGGE